MRRLSRTLAASHHVDLPLAALEEVSDGTSSTFSCAGDLLPDEASDINLIEVAGTDNDFVATKRIAQVLAKRHHVDPDTIMPKLHDLFGLGELSSDHFRPFSEEVQCTTSLAVCGSSSIY